jgi:hypothetical protein
VGIVPSRSTGTLGGSLSFDVAVWHRKRPYSPKEAGPMYQALCQGDTSVVDPDPRIDAFIADLIARYPSIDDYPVEEIDDCPWNCAFDQSAGHVILSMASSRIEEVVPVVAELAAKHRLTVYDPQDNELYLPGDEAAT